MQIAKINLDSDNADQDNNDNNGGNDSGPVDFDGDNSVD
jgi:hypothetical protein